MRVKDVVIATAASAVLAAVSAGAAAQTAWEVAVESGATQLSSAEIASRIVGKTVTAVSGGKRFMFHYSADNVISGKLLGGDWADTGYYGITDDDRVCLSMRKSDNGQLRCLTLLLSDGTVKKYRADGSMGFELLAFQEGKAF